MTWPIALVISQVFMAASIATPALRAKTAAAVFAGLWLSFAVFLRVSP